MISNLGLSRIFWIALAIVYFFLGVAAYAILTLPENTFELANPDHVKAAVKLTYVRFAFISVVMVSYPIVLLSSLRYAYFLQSQQQLGLLLCMLTTIWFCTGL